MDKTLDFFQRIHCCQFLSILIWDFLVWGGAFSPLLDSVVKRRQKSRVVFNRFICRPPRRRTSNEWNKRDFNWFAEIDKALQAGWRIFQLVDGIGDRSRNWKRHKQKMQYGEETIQQWQNGKIHKEGWLGNKATQVGRKERKRWKRGWVANQERRDEKKRQEVKTQEEKKTTPKEKQLTVETMKTQHWWFPTWTDSVAHEASLHYEFWLSLNKMTAALMHLANAASPCLSLCTWPNDEAPYLSHFSPDGVHESVNPFNLTLGWQSWIPQWRGRAILHGLMVTAEKCAEPARHIAPADIQCLLYSSDLSGMVNDVEKLTCYKNIMQKTPNRKQDKAFWLGFSQQVNSQDLNMNYSASMLPCKVSYIS